LEAVSLPFSVYTERIDARLSYLDVYPPQAALGRNVYTEGIENELAVPHAFLEIHYFKVGAESPERERLLEKERIGEVYGLGLSWRKFERTAYRHELFRERIIDPDLPVVNKIPHGVQDMPENFCRDEIRGDKPV